MAAPYVSIDIETTGLNPETCQILEIGAVIDDWVSPLDDLPTFHCYVDHDQIRGEPYALALNQAILKYLAQKDKPCAAHVSNVAQMFSNWLVSHGMRDKIVAAGKNFASFDRPFLMKLPGWGLRLHHRFIDPGMLYWRPAEDPTPPDTKTCMVRADIAGEVAHTAVEDSKTVIRLIRRAFPGLYTVHDL